MIVDAANERIDWEGLKADYRVGRLSNVALAEKYGVTEGAIRKRARKEAWPRDLSDTVKRVTKETLVRDAVRKVRGGDAARTDEDIINAAAEESAAIVRGHRRDIATMASTVRLLGEQLQDVATHRERIAEVIVANTDPKEAAKRTAMMKAISLPAHAGVVRDLTVAAKNLVTLERQAFNIGERAEDDGIESFLRRLED